MGLILRIEASRIRCEVGFLGECNIIQMFSETSDHFELSKTVDVMKSKSIVKSARKLLRKEIYCPKYPTL